MASTTSPGCRQLTKASAVLTMLVVPALLGPQIASGADGYSLVLVVAVSLGVMVAGAQIWRTGAVATEMAAATLAGLIGLVQVAVCLFGGPTGSPPHWSTMAVLLVVVATLALGTLIADVRVGSQILLEKVERPYAL